MKKACKPAMTKVAKGQPKKPINYKNVAKRKTNKA